MSSIIKKLIIPICSAAILFTGLTFFSIPASSNARAAIISTLKNEDQPYSSKEQQIVQVPGSPYTLVIFDSPHKMWLLRTKEFLGRYSSSLDMGFNLYESTFKKDTDCFINNKLVYGLTTIPKGQQAYVKNKKVHVFPLEKYFSSSKYARDYKNLYFYYLDKPVETESGFQAVTLK
ncbi:hypothetical protein JOC77_002134 [Peribacillus deserti]|uniref:Uncharacterized protein n=1 Tax=Peribacillus deserti TaxID=673318 RepID=A0ABS2QHR8_9BACI|nr:hypothetical protein [Peribacillus deserti]MBM7692703.1 hypothetical protein [Peribacillus deserti]